MKNKNKVDSYIRELVKARIRATSDNLKIAVGNRREYSKKELIKSVEKGDEVGREIVEAQIEFLQDMAGGKIYQNA